MFCFVYFEILQTQNRWPNNLQKTSLQSSKTENYPGFEQPSPGAPLLGLAKSNTSLRLAE